MKRWATTPAARLPAVASTAMTTAWPPNAPRLRIRAPSEPIESPEDEEQGSDRELHAPLGFVDEGASAGQVADADTDGKKKKGCGTSYRWFMHTDRHSVLRERKLSVQVNEQKGMRGGSRARHGMPRPEARG